MTALQKELSLAALRHMPGPTAAFIVTLATGDWLWRIGILVAAILVPFLFSWKNKVKLTLDARR